jgi:chorismate dehydratase
LNAPRIGCVKYLNARPLIHGWLGPVDFDHPSVLCQKLRRGDLDLALVSSIEYLRRPQYRIVDAVSVSASGPVYSVIVAHRQELAAIREIAIDPASETSVALLRCLLTEHGIRPRLISETGSGGQLFIGDQAIRFRQAEPHQRVWDLAEDWKNVTGLPFVFALWLVRAEVANATEIADRLRTLRDENLQRLNQLIARTSDFDSEFCQRYFRENLRFDFEEKAKEGLREFHRRCLACGIDVAPGFALNLV